MRILVVSILIQFFISGLNGQEYGSLITKARSLAENQDYSEAIKMSGTIINTFIKEKYPVNDTIIFNNLMNLWSFFHEYGNNRQLIKFLKSELDSLNIIGSTNNRYYFALLVIIARSYLDINEINESGRYFQILKNSIDTIKYIPPRYIGICYGWFGIYNQEIGNMSAAKEYFLKSYKHRKFYYDNRNEYSENPKGEYWDCLYDMSYYYYLTADYEKSLYYGLEALNLNQAAELPFVMNIELIGRIYLKLKQNDLAYSNLRTSNEKHLFFKYQNHFRYGFNCIYLAEALFRLDRFDEANELIKNGLNVIRNHRHYNQKYLTEALVYSAELYVQTQQYDSAKVSFMEALDKFRKFVAEPLNAMTFEETKSYIHLNMTMLNKFYNFVLLKHKEYPELIDICYEMRILTKDLDPEYSKKFAACKENSTTETTNLYDKWKDTRERIAKLYSFFKVNPENENNNILDSLANEAENIEKELRFKLADNINKKNIDIKLSDIQSKLNETDAALEIIRIENSFDPTLDTIVYVALLLTITSAKPEFLIIGKGTALEGAALATYKAAVMPEKKNNNSYSELLNIKKQIIGNLKSSFINYWSVIDEKIHEKGRIYISSDGVYHLVNLNALINSDNKYLIEVKDLVYINCTKDLIHYNTHINPDKKEIALFGNPDFDYSFGAVDDSSEKQSFIISEKSDIIETIFRSSANREWKYLKNSGKEIGSISKLLSKKKIKNTLFEHFNASELNIKNRNNPAILHIATHGFFDTKNDNNYNNPLLRSGLVLSGANNSIRLMKKGDIASLMKLPDDGILTAYEVINLNLTSTNLVILSACETGLGETSNGNGVFGLQRAFKTAGAANLIMSLWQVDDASTSILMQEFYKLLLKTKDIHKSFQQAQVNMIKSGEYSLPGQWAPFILISN